MPAFFAGESQRFRSAVVHSLVSAPATAACTAAGAIILSSADIFSSRTPWRTGAAASERSEVRETTERRSASSAAMPALDSETEAATGTSVAVGSEEAMPTVDRGGGRQHGEGPGHDGGARAEAGIGVPLVA